MPYTLVRKIVPASIEYRKHNRNPLTREELDNLSSCLYELEIDMRQELAKVKLNVSLPRITVPPAKLIELLHQYELAPQIIGEPQELFLNGHFNESVRKACELLEDYVREIASRDISGRELMAKAFSTSEFIRLDKIKSQNQNDFSLGFRFLAMGTMSAIRNVFSHSDEQPRSPEESFEMLFFINWLFRYIR